MITSEFAAGTDDDIDSTNAQDGIHLAPIFAEQVLDGEKPSDNISGEGVAERLVSWVQRNGGTMSEKVSLTPSTVGGQTCRAGEAAEIM